MISFKGQRFDFKHPDNKYWRVEIFLLHKGAFFDVLGRTTLKIPFWEQALKRFLKKFMFLRKFIPTYFFHFS